MLGAAMIFSSAEAADYAVGAFFTSNADVNLQFYRSDDMVHMDRLSLETDISGRDPSIRYRNGTFYICLVEPAESGQTFKILTTKDFSEWTTHSFNVTERDEKFDAIWAPDLFIDADGAAYVYFSKQNGVDKKTREKTFDIWVSRAPSIESMNFEPAVKIPLSNYESVIDAHVRKIDGAYYMIVKDEKIHTNNDNKSPRMFRSSEPDKNFIEVENWALSAVRGCEGFSIVDGGGKIYIYADNYSGKYDAAPPSHHTVWITDDIENGPFRAEYVESVRPMRHGSVIMIDDPTLNNLIDQMSAERSTVEIPTRTITFERDDYGIVKGHGLEIEKFAPAPNVIYRVPKKMRVHISELINAYGVKRIEFVLKPGASLDFANILRRDNDGKSDKKYILEHETGGWRVAAK